MFVYWLFYATCPLAHVAGARRAGRERLIEFMSAKHETDAFMFVGI